MKLSILPLLLAFALLGCARKSMPPTASTSLLQPTVDAEAERLRFSFNEMAAHGWHIDQPIPYTYTFLDPSRQPLLDLSKRLEAEGYNVLSLERTLPEDEMQEQYLLEVQRTEVHSPASLAARNRQLRAFARLFSVNSYDGWEAGPPRSSSPLPRRK